MKIKDKFIEVFFGGVIEKMVTDRLQAASITDRAEDEGWRKLTGDSTRSLPAVTHERAIEISYHMWKYNPLGNWIIEIITAFVVGEGVSIEAKNETVKKVLDEFWNHPVNNMPIYLEKHVRELGIYGEQCWPKFTSQNAGKVVLGYIDPAQIKKVVTDPENCKIVIAVITKGKDFRDGKKYKTVLDPEVDPFLSPDARAIRESCDYECYLFAINNVTNDPRGTSDLFVLADWLDAYEQFLFDYAEKWVLLNVFVWDLLVQNGTPETIGDQIKAFTKKSGSVYGHNEKVTLTPSTPDLKSIDAEKGARLIRNHILGNKSIPSVWYGGGEDANLASSKEMSTPTYKLMSSRQRLVIYILTYVLNDVLREADAHGMLKGVPEEEKTFKINAPELASKDITKFAAAIQQLANSLVSAQTQEWIDQETAVKIFAFCLALIGYEIDVEAVKAKLEEEASTKGYEDYAKDRGKGPGSGSEEDE